MATLDKLQICGIRSFGPNEENVQQLSFDTPVTLILGQNGCGKTTIIESIKFACSGELPSGSKNGQAFVNDPKMSNTSYTKGHIKLRFLDPAGREVSLYRIIELTRTQSSMKFSSKDATICVRDEQGKESMISGRCADITTECCQLMNVAPSVLNNVIFCHQEDSLWPLDEGQKLKDKFDAIFDSQKYNKCTEQFRKQIKLKQERVKLLQIQVAYKKEKHETAIKLGKNLSDKEEQVMKLEEEICVKSDEVQVMKNRIDEIVQLEMNLSDLQQELATKQTTKNGVVEEQNNIKKNLQVVFEGDDEQLKNEIDNFHRNRKEEETVVRSLEDKLEETENLIRTIAENMQSARAEFGGLTELKKQQEERLVQRTELLLQVMKDMNFQNVKDVHPEVGIYQITKELENQQELLKNILENSEKEEAKLQHEIDLKRDKTVSTNENVKTKTIELEESTKKLEEITSTLSNFSTLDSMLSDLRKKIDSFDKTIANLEKNFREAENDKKIDEYKSKIKNSKSVLDALEADLKILRQNDVVEAKIECEKNLIVTKQKEATRIQTTHSNSLKELFDGKVPEKNIKEFIKKKLTSSDILIQNLNNDITKKQKEVTTLEVQRDSQKEKMLNAEKELKLKRKKILEACNGSDFNESLQQSFQRKERLQIDKGQYSSVKIIYEEFIKKFAVENPCCPVCERDFENNKNLVQKIISNLQSKVNRVPQELSKVVNELKQEEIFYNKLQQLKIVNEEAELLEKEKLPQLKLGLSEIEQNLNGSFNELSELKRELIQPQRIVEVSNRIISDIGLLDRYKNEVDESRKKLEILQKSLVELPSRQSKQEVEASIDKINMEMDNFREKIDICLKNIRIHQDRIQNIIQDRKIVSDKEAKLKDTIQSRPHMEIQKKDLTIKIDSLTQEISQLRVQLVEEEELLKIAANNKKSHIQASKQRIDGQRQKVKYFYDAVQDIDKLNNAIESYYKEENDTKLATIESRLSELELKENKQKDAKNTCMKLISDKKESLAKYQITYRNLQDNVLLREKRLIEKTLENEVNQLKTRIGCYNYKTVYEEKRRLQMKRETSEQEISRLEGTKTTLLQTLNEIKEELQKPDIKKAYTYYLEKLYELKLLKFEIEDIFKYVSALEKAILEFHKCKMIQINKTVRHLWRNTYRGNDIDYIEIKTEYSKGYVTRRLYNYKVVQVKKGVELDMRGRCSAGQKVLACLIIRMALAETLSVNCGILALDEPTTNLDRANILSLSDTLAEIITNRQREKAFQLIVITHDEEFLNLLTRKQSINSYYKIERDKDGFSVITKLNAIF